MTGVASQIPHPRAPDRHTVGSPCESDGLHVHRHRFCLMRRRLVALLVCGKVPEVSKSRHSSQWAEYDKDREPLDLLYVPTPFFAAAR